MKRKLWLGLFFMPFLLNAQMTGRRAVDVTFTVPSIAIIDLAPDKSTIHLKADVPDQAGDPVDMSKAVNQDKWLNYSSSLRPGGAYRNIAVQIVSGELPHGIRLKLRAGNYSGNGKGKLGKSNGELTLSNIPQVIVRDIGAAVSGRGKNSGHQLFWTLDYQEYGDIDFGQEALVIAFTLTDN